MFLYYEFFFVIFLFYLFPFKMAVGDYVVVVVVNFILVRFFIPSYSVMKSIASFVICNWLSWEKEEKRSRTIWTNLVLRNWFNCSMAAFFIFLFRSFLRRRGRDTVGSWIWKERERARETWEKKIETIWNSSGFRVWSTDLMQ